MRMQKLTVEPEQVEYQPCRKFRFKSTPYDPPAFGERFFRQDGVDSNTNSYPSELMIAISQIW